MSARLPRGVSGKQTIRALERAGWRVHRTRGSHVALVHPDFEPTVIVPQHRELRLGTPSQILKTAQMSRGEFSRLLR